MKILEIPPGVKVGQILEALLQEVMDDPGKNSRDRLVARVKELGVLTEQELVATAAAAESKIELAEDERVSSIKAKYYVK